MHLYYPLLYVRLTRRVTVLLETINTNKYIFILNNYQIKRNTTKNLKHKQ